MMLVKERELLLHLAFRSLRREEEWLDFLKHHHAPADQVEVVAGEVDQIRQKVSHLPCGPDYLREYDHQKARSYTPKQER